MGIRGKIWCGIILILVVGFGISFYLERPVQKSAAEKYAEVQLRKMVVDDYFKAIESGNMKRAAQIDKENPWLNSKE